MFRCIKKDLPQVSDRPYKIPESVLVVIHTDDLQVLLLERADQPGFWQSVTGSKDSADGAAAPPGGGGGGAPPARGVAHPPRPGEPEAARAGLRDWGLRNVYEIYPVWRHRYAPGITHNTEHVFGLRVPRGIPVVLAPREHLRFEWLPWREAADRCFSPSNAEAILQLPRCV